MYDQKLEVVRSIDPEWDVDINGHLVCPCGSLVEDDGQCPEGHVSPLRRAGFI